MMLAMIVRCTIILSRSGRKEELLILNVYCLYAMSERIIFKPACFIPLLFFAVLFFEKQGIIRKKHKQIGSENERK